MAEFLRDDSGQPVFIQGYGAVYDALRSDSNDELVKPGAFDRILKYPSAALNCQFHHLGLDFIAGCLALDTLQVWTDPLGLGFNVGPFHACGRNLSFLRLIASGNVRGASWSGTVAGSGWRHEMFNGERVKSIHHFKILDHIALVADPAYPSTGVWLSSEHYYDLTPRLRALSDHWVANRPRYDAPAALRKMSRAVSRLPRRAVPPPATPRSQARPVARRRVLAPMALHEIYPAFGGFSSVEIAKMAFDESKVWRMLRAENPDISRAQLRCSA